MKTRTTRSIVASTAVLNIGTTEAFVGGVYSASQHPIAFQRQRLPNTNNFFAAAPGSDTGSSFFKGKLIWSNGRWTHSLATEYQYLYQGASSTAYYISNLKELFHTRQQWWEPRKSSKAKKGRKSRASCRRRIKHWGKCTRSRRTLYGGTRRD